MKSNGTIILSLFGGIAVGSALTLILAKKGKINTQKIHDKIMGELSEIHNCVKMHIDERCNCDEKQPQNE